MTIMYFIVIVLLPAIMAVLCLAPWPLLIPAMLVVVAIEAMLIWTMADTAFIIDETYFSFRSGPWKRKIKIEDIREIAYSNSWVKPSLWKIGLDTQGLIVYYNKFDDVFISPENRDAFLDEISRLNPDIRVIRS